MNSVVVTLLLYCAIYTYIGKARPTENELKLKELIRYFVESNVSYEFGSDECVYCGTYYPLNNTLAVFKYVCTYILY